MRSGYLYIPKWAVLVPALALAAPACGLENGLALTPPMGWNSYNYYKLNVTEAQVKATANAFVSSGLKDAGYRYIVIDDMWASGRDGSGNLVPDKSKFPGGMKALADYIHGAGLKFGIYANPTTISCGGEPGSYGHEKQDADLFASWGVDYLKYDWCGKQSGENGKFTDAQIVARYVTMREALKATGRPIVYALCDKGQGVTKLNISAWSDTVGHMWRIGNDIAASWDRIWAQIDNNAPRAAYAHPGGWNDPDMLEAGNGSLTEAEDRAHFSMWCIMASPLILGNNVSAMSASVRSILVNKEAVAIDQDSLGRQGVKVATSGSVEAWVKDLGNGDKAVVFANRGTAAASASLRWTDASIKWGAGDKVDVRDIWKGTDQKGVASGIDVNVPAHDALFYRLRNPAVVSLRARTGLPAGAAIIGRGGAISLYLPPGTKAERAEITESTGRRVAAFPLRPGRNAFPIVLRPDRMYVLSILGGQGKPARTLLLAP